MKLPLSLEQESFFGPDPVSAPNITITHKLDGPLDVDALQTAITSLLRRHEGLRFRLTGTGRCDGQRIADPADVVIQPVPVPAGQIRGRVDAAHEAPLDLYADGPIRFGLFTTGPGEHILTTTIHPAALDAWGEGTVVNEMWALYEAARTGEDAGLPDLPRSFSDHVRRQHLAGLGLTARQRERFVSQLGDPLGLPWRDPGRPAAPLARRAFALDRETLAAISQVGRQIHVTAPTIFLAGFQLALGLAAHAETGSMSTIYFGRDTPGTPGLAAALARRVPLLFGITPTARLGDFVQQTMQDWAISISDSAPPYSSARLRREVGGPLDAVEPIFNLRVTRDGTSSQADDDANDDDRDEPVLDVDWLPRPASRPVPFWSQFGQAALFALVTLGPDPAVTAIYDPGQVAGQTTDVIFGTYRRIVQAIADGEVRQSVDELRRRLGSSCVLVPEGQARGA